MPSLWVYLDPFLFSVLPYIAFFSFFLLTIQRYRQRGFSYSSYSSQILENRLHFWSTVPFHYGILVVLTGHVVGFMFPRQLLLFNSRPVRLYILEVSALIFGLLALVGLVTAIARRIIEPKVRGLTSVPDWILYGMLLVQVASGVNLAVFHSWGISWFAATATPYLQSVIMLNPDFSSIAGMPFSVKLHIVNAFLLIGFFPFTRLVHILVVPNPYLWRKPQVVRWYSRPPSTTVAQGAAVGETRGRFVRN
ncbi:MAG: respiratory nitrate reductase subunit gamma [Acidobacteria bacterium]|nr:respiratory nitrate reductase subunit gamma [Acidobacteriota bacterium]